MGQGFGSLTVRWCSKLYIWMDWNVPVAQRKGDFLSLLTNHEGFIIINSISPAKQQQR